MIRTLIRKLKRIILINNSIEGMPRYLCIIDELLGRKVVRVIRVGGAVIRVRTNTPDIDVAISSLGEMEYGHVHLQNPQAIIDAGANIGASTIYFARKYPDALVIAVEPEAGNFRMLLENTGLYKNIIALNAAVWGVDDRRTVKNRFTGEWGYTVTDTGNATESTGQEIECVTIRTIMEKFSLGHIDLLKMDIEGGEKSVLENSSDWMDSVNIITIELHDNICMGCDRAFYLSTAKFTRFERHGEKVTAYRS